MQILSVSAGGNPSSNSLVVLCGPCRSLVGARWELAAACHPGPRLPITDDDNAWLSNVDVDAVLALRHKGIDIFHDHGRRRFSSCLNIE